MATQTFATLGLMVGFVIMMILDVGLGITCHHLVTQMQGDFFYINMIK